MQFDGVFTATLQSTAFASADVGLIELQVPASTMAVILRVWIGAAEGTDPVDEVQEVAFYVNDAAGTGTAMTEQRLSGGDTAPSTVAVSTVTVGATPTEIMYDGYHVQNGFLYLPVPEERILVKGGSSVDNFGMLFPVAPDASMTVSCGIVWGELSTV